MPYHLQPANGGYYVVSDSGKRRSKRPLPKTRAQAQMRALYARDPHAKRKEVTESPDVIVSHLWASGVKKSDITGIWFSPSDSTWFVSVGDWAASNAYDKIREFFGSSVTIVDEGVPDQDSAEAKFSQAVRFKSYTLDDLERAVLDNSPAAMIEHIAAYTPALITLKGERIAPGITRIRGNLCNVHGRYGPCDAAMSGSSARATIDRNKRINAQAAQGGGKGTRKRRARASAKPKKTEGQRAAEREAKKRERDAEREAKRLEADAARRAERDRILSEAGIDKNLQGALIDARDGNTLTPTNGAKLAEQGLAEQGSDGTYRLSPKGTQLVNAANRGDAGEVARVQGEARDQVATQRKRATERAQRQQERDARRAEAERRRQERRGGGGSKKTEPKKEVARPRAPQRRRASSGGPSRSPSSSSSASAIGRRAEARRRREERVQREATRQRERAETGQRRQEERAQVETRRTQRDREAEERRRITTPEMADAARKVRDGEVVTEQQAQALIRSGLARRARDGVLVLSETGLRAARQKEAPPSFAVFKDAKGRYRWIAHTTTAYRDRDGEILALKGLEANARRMTETGIYGPLRFWHIGQPNPFSDTEPWGAGLDIGDCDFSLLIGRTLVESGTFRSPAVAEKMASDQAGYEMSPGFFHSASEPDADGVFETFLIFERSPVPRDHARASNLFTAFRVKEHRMDPQEFERRLKVAEQKLGLSPEQTAAERAALLQTDKDASDRRIAFKSDEAPQVYTAPDGMQGIIQDGRFVALKAAPVAPTEEPPIPVEEKAEVMVEEVEEEEAAEGGETYVGDMTQGELRGLMEQTFESVLARSMGAISDKVSSLDNEMKALGYTRQKEEGERAAIKAELEARTKEAADLAARLVVLEGDQPSSVKTGFRASLNGPVADAATLKELNAPQSPPAGAFDDINQFLLGANGASRPS